MLGAKPLATLSSGLLARKGHARPAMRSPATVSVPGPAAADDLGWNDMGDAASAPPLPQVLAQRHALRDELEQSAPPAKEERAAAAPLAPDSAPLAPHLVERIGREAARDGKAAFTLRLPADRHLRLRLASAVRHRSAQAIVTEALDAFLAALPEVEDLARQVAAPAAAPKVGAKP